MAGGTTKSTTDVKLPQWAEGTAQNLLWRGTDLSNAPYQQYGGQRYADFTDPQQEALGGVAARARSGNALENAGQGYLQNVVGGGAANPYGGATNPYFEKQLQGALGDVQSRVNTQFSNPNAWGSSGHNEVLANSLGNTASQMRMGQYDRAADLYGQDRAAMMNAASMAPQFAAGDYTDLRALMGVGDAQRARNQDIYNQQYGDWQSMVNQPYKNLDVLGSALQSATRGYQSTAASGPGTSPLAGAIGGGLAGYGLGSMMGDYGSYGAGAGALLGALS